MKNQYIQFYTRSKSNPSSHMLVEDKENILPLDGRLSLGSCCVEGVKQCRLGGHKGFRIMVRKNVTSKTGSYNTIHMLTDCYKVTKLSVEN